jgi:glycosyltransferase involved in cell wall biosynthesis
VGGISTIIQEGKNGFFYSLHDGPEKYCDTVERLWSSKEEYEQLALSSFYEYSERLNWASSGQKVNDLIHEFCG